jgi:hypothetical protein
LIYLHTSAPHLLDPQFEFLLLSLLGIDEIFAKEGLSQLSEPFPGYSTRSGFFERSFVFPFPTIFRAHDP